MSEGSGFADLGFTQDWVGGLASDADVEVFQALERETRE